MFFFNLKTFISQEDDRKSSEPVKNSALFGFIRRNSLGDKDKPSRPGGANKTSKNSPSSNGQKTVTGKMNNIKISDPDGEFEKECCREKIETKANPKSVLKNSKSILIIWQKNQR